MTTTEDRLDKLFGQILRESISRDKIEPELRALFYAFDEPLTVGATKREAVTSSRKPDQGLLKPIGIRTPRRVTATILAGKQGLTFNGKVAAAV